MTTYSQLLNTTNGHFDELYVRIPPSNEYADLAQTVTAVATLSADTSAFSDDMAQQGQDIDALKDKDNTLQDLINTKQNELTLASP